MAGHDIAAALLGTVALAQLANTAHKEGIRGALTELGLAIKPTHTKTAAGFISSIAGAPFAEAGRQALGLLGKIKSPWAAKAVPKLQELGGGLAGQMGSWGLLGGGLEAALAEPGERGKGFARGFGLGALGGLGWGAGSRLAQRGVGRLMSKTPGAGAARLEALEKQKAFFNLDKQYGPRGLVHNVPLGERAKILGGKLVPFAGGVVGSDVLMKSIGQPGMIDIVRGTANKPAYGMPQVYGPLMQGLPLDPQQYYAQQPLSPTAYAGYNQGYG